MASQRKRKRNDASDVLMGNAHQHHERARARYRKIHHFLYFSLLGDQRTPHFQILILRYSPGRNKGKGKGKGNTRQAVLIPEPTGIVVMSSSSSSATNGGGFRSHSSPDRRQRRRMRMQEPLHRDNTMAVLVCFKSVK